MAKEQGATQKKKRPQAKKRDIQNEKRRMQNKTFKSQVRTAVRKFEEGIKKGDAETIQTTLNEIYSMMDKGVKRGIYKLNKASRTKSRLTAKAAAAKG